MIDLTTESPEHRGPWGAEAVIFAQMLTDGLATMCGMKKVPTEDPARLPENREYPGQPGKKRPVEKIVHEVEISADGVRVPIPAGSTVLDIRVDGSLHLVDADGESRWHIMASNQDLVDLVAVARLRRKLDERAGKGMDPMFDAEIRAILDGDAADDEPMTTGELDRAGMYGGEFGGIQQPNRHVFPSMLGAAPCNKCGITRSQALVQTHGRWCTGTMNTRPV